MQNSEYDQAFLQDLIHDDVREPVNDEFSGVVKADQSGLGRASFGDFGPPHMGRGQSGLPWRGLSLPQSIVIVFRSDTADGDQSTRTDLTGAPGFPAKNAHLHRERLPLVPQPPGYP
jgi:hypothetical protein